MGKSDKRPFHVTAQVTISLNAQVWASSEKEAVELAAELSMPSFNENRRYREHGVSDDEWRTSGELDGEPTDLVVEELDEGLESDD